MTALSIFAAARETPERVALIIGSARYTYSELAALTQERAAVLSQTSAPLLLQPQLDLESLLWLYAASATGTTFLPLHAGTTPGERAAAQALSGAQYMPGLLEPATAPFLERGIDPERPYAFMLTSGSSASPKIVILSRRAVLASAAASERNLGCGNEERWLLCLPLSHVGGLSILVRMLAARRTVVLLEPGGAGLLERIGELHRQIREQCVTLVSLVPIVLERLLQEGFESPPALRAVLVGGAGCSPALASRARGAGVPLLTSYGLTETGSQVVARRYAERDAPLALRSGRVSSGQPLAGVDIRIVGERIAIRGAALLSGYLGASSPALEEGWFLTHDRGVLGSSGELYVLGREDLVIVTGGEKVDPEEVESALRTLPEVADACVCGLSCAEFGQRVAVVVVTQAHSVPLPLGQLRERLAVHLAPFKLPREILNAAALPISAMGKLDRRACAMLFEAGGQSRPDLMSAL
jgi:O-succinylbenzoic acid--CoA ligase